MIGSLRNSRSPLAPSLPSPAAVTCRDALRSRKTGRRERSRGLGWGNATREISRVHNLALGMLALLAQFALALPASAEQNEPVIEPQVDRRDIRIPKIKVDDIEFGVYGGILSVQDFGSKPVFGARLAYHLTE